MKLPRFVSTRFTSAVALGCALLAFAAVPSAQAQMKIIPLTMDKVDKMGKLIQSVNADPAAKAAMEETSKDETISTAMMSGGSINDTINTKYPKAAALYKAAGITPDDFMATIMSISMAATGSADGTSDAAVAKTNVDFFNANKDKIEKIMETMK